MKLTAIAVAIAAVLAYQVGLLERPPFEYKNSFLDGQELLAIVATCTSKDIAGNVARLMEGLKSALDQVILETTNNNDKRFASMMAAAAQRYGSPEGAQELGLGLYFDNPSETEHPRWALGWAMEGASMDDLQSLLPALQTASQLKEPIRVVRIGGPNTETLTAQIPWRNYFTPMIAPALHWKRGFDTYASHRHTRGDKKEEMEDNMDGSHATALMDERDDSIALEVYVTGPNDTMGWLDYTVLFGNVANTWNDAFPNSQATQQKVEAAEEPAGTEHTMQEEEPVQAEAL